MDYCHKCSVVLSLNVSCQESRTMDITSHHLEYVVQTEGSDPYDSEANKRVENFGFPVGKGMPKRHFPP
jgi:DNA-directed RNA polymerase II subunit RPB3